MAFPIIGYLVLLSSQFTSFFDGGLAGNSGGHGGNWFDYLWSLKLYYVYFGLLHLGVGSALYQWGCPRQIKKHGDWEDYIRVDGPAMTDTYIEAIGEMIGVDFLNSVRRPGETLFSAKIHLLRLHYAALSAEAPAFRLVVAYLFLFGLALLALPSMMTAFKITKLFLSS
ncbi:hypothetical protein UB31_22170 [Bradyrhizobium sp. LTSP849]|uniref:hypothetical protein n=1 Tax=Bradyrhizobium sp. LTSP849 TaxID=1615890 RepID=UPI0005D242C2|nr:hypothetical protein [Bradyrhizobium sp. LTSP849]KJC44006.1 hypothetical protein UB31_22170 [Bradyrhizobium sp. LTSP849]